MRPGLLAAVHLNAVAPGPFVRRVRSRTDTDPAREADDR